VIPLSRRGAAARKNAGNDHQPGGVDEKLQTQADSILEKISLEGEESLTSKERRILNKYSAQIRKNRD
jgi:hypothetical protein